jgi:ADP-ribose pyrophosphatase YjhB (NUDIX family)
VVRFEYFALGIILRGDELLVAEGYDPSKRQTFYRPLGGGVEFSESARDALIREFAEEIGAELVNIRYLATLGNIFTYDDQPGHEIILLLQADFADETLYARDDLVVIEGNERASAAWKRLADCTDETPLYPEGLRDLLAHRSNCRPLGVYRVPADIQYVRSMVWRLYTAGIDACSATPAVPLFFRLFCRQLRYRATRKIARETTAMGSGWIKGIHSHWFNQLCAA